MLPYVHTIVNEPTLFHTIRLLACATCPGKLSRPDSSSMFLFRNLFVISVF